MLEVTVKYHFLFLICFLITLSAYSDENLQDSRKENLIAQRKAKLQHLQEPPSPSIFQKVFAKIESEQSAFHFGPEHSPSGFAPEIGNIVTGSGIAFGGRYHHSIFSTDAAYSTKGYQQFNLKIGWNPPVQSIFLQTFRIDDVYAARVLQKAGPYIFGEFRYRDLTQEDYYGPGLDSLKQDQTDYDLREIYVGVAAGYFFEKHIQLDFRAGYLNQSIDHGTNNSLPDIHDIFDDSSAPGLSQQPDFFRYSTSLLFDYRDKPGNPHDGGALGVMWSRYDDRNLNEFDFNRVAVDAREFVPLGSPARTLALHFLTALSFNPDGEEVPFYLQPTLGGGNTLEGYSEYRFRDNNALLMAAEYRWEPAPFLELALLYNAGKVFASHSDFNFNDLRKGYGVGVRFKTPDYLIFRIDFARGDEGNIVYFKFGASF
ncbi:MAG: hypothetical protein C5B54_11955 [Acidobacteria bacterium]|nr:MAG: hypothetical protein C5B54_11955 [Acidobacteriota bacterium]